MARLVEKHSQKIVRCGTGSKISQKIQPLQLQYRCQEYLNELDTLRVYESMMLQKQAEQISALQQEIATLRQNAENTARAPVSAAAVGPDSEPEDLFLKGFNSY